MAAAASSSKRILIIGGTGAQGSEVARALLSSQEPYTIRILTRNPDAPYVQSLFPDNPAVEFATGSFMDFEAVRSALQGCYGVYVNTDSYTVNEQDELWAGVRVWEIANSVPGLRHFVYASIDYYLELTGWDERFGAHHTNGKGRVAAYLRSQKSVGNEDGLAWTVVNTAMYNEDLMAGLMNPRISEDGEAVFALPLGDPSGAIPFGTLRDHGIFARIVFEDRARWSGKIFSIASHFATGPEIAETFSKVNGRRARYEHVSIDEWASANVADKANKPVASTDPEGITFKENMAMWWPGFQESILYRLGTRDVELLRVLHPEIESLEGWMRRVEYDGKERSIFKPS